MTEATAARSRPLRTAIEWVLIIVAALGVAFAIKTWLVQAFYIPSPSMTPTLAVQDRVLVNKLSYRLHDVNRGDLVVFERPDGDDEDAADPEIRDLIKRVIGLPGEQLETRDGVVYVDGRRLEEPYLAPGTSTDAPPIDPVTVPSGHVFVMGDNRNNSKDSRSFGAVPVDSIIGRAFVRVWPPGELSSL